MVNKRISIRQKRYTKTISKKEKQEEEVMIKPEMEHRVHDWDPEEYICDGSNIKNAIWECLQDNDPEGVVEVIEIYLNSMNKRKQREKNDLSNSTMYHAIRSKNPTIKTLCKLIHCCM